MVSPLQGVPGTPSGTYNFGLSNGELMLEAFSRCQIRPTELVTHHTSDFTRSLNLALQSWANKGVNLFSIVQDFIQVVPGQATYILPPNIIAITDAYFGQIITTGPGPDWDAPLYDPSQPIVSNDPQTVVTQSMDRWLQPLGRADYARIPNKTLPGLITSYWFNRLGPPTPLTITFWQEPTVGYPEWGVTYFAVRQLQDANLPNGETPDVPNRALDALCAEAAMRIARKYAPQLIGPPGSGGLRDDRDEAWALFIAEDTEKAPIHIAPDVSPYWQI